MKNAVKYRLTEHLTRLLIISSVAIVVLLPVHAFVSTWLGTAIGPLLVWKSWKEILLALLVPAVVALCFLRPDLTKVVWTRSINKLIAAYVVLHFILTIFAQASNDAVLAGLLINLRFLALFVLVQVVVASGHPWIERLKVWIPGWLLWTMAILSFLAILQVSVMPKDFLDSFGYDKDSTISPITVVDDNPDALRAFATMRGPNTLGAYLILPLLVAIYFVVRRQQLVLASISGILGLFAFFLTGSRSAWIGFAVAVIMFGVLMLPRARLKRWVKLGALPALAIGGLLLWAAVTIPPVRLAIFHSSPGDPHLFEGSTQKHWEATTEGLRYIGAHPLGTGPGSAGPASFYNSEGNPIISENYFVQVGQEVGVLGLALFLAICTLVVKALYQNRDALAQLLLASFVGLTAINMFLHGWADDPTAMTWWALAGLCIAEQKLPWWKMWFNKKKANQ